MAISSARRNSPACSDPLHHNEGSSGHHHSCCNASKVMVSCASANHGQQGNCRHHLHTQWYVIFLNESSCLGLREHAALGILAVLSLGSLWSKWFAHEWIALRQSIRAPGEMLWMLCRGQLGVYGPASGALSACSPKHHTHEPAAEAAPACDHAWISEHRGLQSPPACTVLLQWPPAVAAGCGQPAFRVAVVSSPPSQRA